MKNSKAFTLIELIAVLVILSLLTVIAVPAISHLIKRNKDKSFNTKINVIIKQAKQYSYDNENFLNGSNKRYDGYVCNTITVGELKNLGYLEELEKESGTNKITDPRTNESMENYTVMLYIKSNTTGTGTNKTAGALVGTIKNIDKCESSGDIFIYTGREEVFTAATAGKYKIEAWGAEGGSASKTYRGGYGAYSYGEITLAQNEKLYINVGGQGGVTLQANVIELGGYNGGGIAVNGNSDSLSLNVGAGGGASSVALSSGLLRSFENDPSQVIIVAAGGGGGKYYADRYHATGGDAGGIAGGDAKDLQWYDNYGRGASQTAAGCNSTGGSCGSFGASNLPGSPTPTTGGGGGYYGGSGGQYGGGGGSSYIGNSRLTNKGMYCYNCTESSDASTKTTSTTCVEADAKVNCAKKGAGAVRITRIE